MKKSLILFCWFAIVSCTSDNPTAEQFTIAPKPKKESNNQLKEAIGDGLMRTTLTSAKIVEKEGFIQRILITDGSRLICQEKNKFNTASNAELQEYRKNLEDLERIKKSYEEALESKLHYFKKNHYRSSKK